jgi:hypothetical protein
MERERFVEVIDRAYGGRRKNPHPPEFPALRAAASRRRSRLVRSDP